MEVRLNWFPLQHFEYLGAVDAQLPYNKRAGIYIWGFKESITGLFWPYYVGKHRNVPFRLCEHLCNLNGANYTIYAPQNLFQLSDKRYYRPEVLADRVLFVKESFTNEQKEYVDYMINRFHFTYCLLDAFDEYGDAAEKTVLSCFSRDVLLNKKYGKPNARIDIGNLFCEGLLDGKWDNR